MFFHMTLCIGMFCIFENREKIVFDFRRLSSGEEIRGEIRDAANLHLRGPEAPRGWHRGAIYHRSGPVKFKCELKLLGSRTRWKSPATRSLSIALRTRVEKSPGTALSRLVMGVVVHAVGEKRAV